MRNFYTTVVELNQDFVDHVSTAPYEAAWAAEAIFFVTAAQAEFDSLALRVQISPDGINWVDEGSTVEAAPDGTLAWARVLHFGGFLRLAGEFTGKNRRGVLTVHLALKE